MKCLIVLTFVAVCSASTSPSGWGSGRSFSVNSDGSITVSSADGRRITISRNAGPITQYQSRYQPSQVDDSLVRLFENYQGDVDRDAYQQLLEEKRREVYEGLQNLNQGQSQVGQSQLGRLLAGQGDQKQFWQELQLLQQAQQLQQQYPRGIVQASPYKYYLRGFGYQGGRPSWNELINDLAYANRQQTIYGQQRQQPVIGQLAQGIQGERQVLSLQDQIQQQQLQRQVQQQQLLQQQWLQQKEQQEQQREQQYIEQLRRQVEQEQEQVLAQEQRLQQQQDLQQRLQQEQQERYGPIRNWLGGARWTGSRSQQPYVWQQQPGVYSQGRYYGVSDQGLQRLIAPWVF